MAESPANDLEKGRACDLHCFTTLESFSSFLILLTWKRSINPLKVTKQNNFLRKNLPELLSLRKTW